MNRHDTSRYTIAMNPLPAPNVPGDTEAARLDSAVRKMFTVTREQMKKREADWQKTNGKKPKSP